MAEGQRTLLVVDDEPELRNILVEMLKQSFPQLNIQTANDGKDAYDKISTQRPEIMYTDVGMPQMSGDVLLERLLEDMKSDSTKKPIPTIVTSGLDLNTERGQRAVEFALRMYTEPQLERIKTYTPPPLPNGQPPHYKGFTSLDKPYNHGDLIARTQLILDML